MEINTGMISGVKIIKSINRRKTVNARLINNVMHVYAPYRISQDKLDEIINSLKLRFNRAMVKARLNKEKPLKEIAEYINRKYFNGKLNISSIEYVTDQTSKFGCCNYVNKSIRISHRVAHMPDWVRDYVVIHEMAHLIEPNHGSPFWDIVSKYRLSERARGYLIAKGLEKEPDIPEGDSGKLIP